MKILMIAPQPFFQPRGTPFSVLHRLKALSLLGHQVDLVTYHIGEDIPVENVTIYRTVKIPFIRNIEIGPSFKKIICDIFILIDAIRRLSTGKYDILHVHEEAGFMAIVLSPAFRIPYVYDMHSSLPQQLKNFNRGNIRPIVRAFEWLEKLTLNRAAAIITICTDLQQIVNRVTPKKHSVLIENVADNSIVFGSGEHIDIKKKYKIPDGKKVILYTGTFENYQGIELLLRAAEHFLKSSHEGVFVLAGGTPEQIESMNGLTRQLKIEENVILTGTVHPREIEYFYSISDIIVSPRIEGTNSPLKLYSYLRSRKPIVATNLYTHTQVLNENVAVLVPPEPEAFAQGMVKALDDEALKNELVQNAKKLAEEKYSYQDYLNKTASVYDTVET